MLYPVNLQTDYGMGLNTMFGENQDPNSYSGNFLDKDNYEQYEGVMVLACLLRPKIRGQLRLRSGFTFL